MMETCRNCKFWVVNPQDLTTGDCHAKPPMGYPFPMEGKMGVLSVRPNTKGDDIACESFRTKLPIVK